MNRVGSDENEPPSPGEVDTKQEKDCVSTGCEAKPWGQGKASDSHIGGHVLEPPKALRRIGTSPLWLLCGEKNAE
jgi:hypothetical protein